MPVDTHLAGMLELMATAPPLHAGTPEEGRHAMRAMTVDLVTPDTLVPVGSVEDVTVPGGDGERAARIYRPSGDGPWPTTVFFHGGGFVIGDIDTHDQTCRRICSGADTVVVSVDYRLAPEHPFPAGLDDAIAATRWTADHQADLGGGERLAVAGDSAGGNLSAVVAQTLPDLVDAQFLIYPATDVLGEHPSRGENAEGYFLDMAMMEWFFTHYVTDVEGVEATDVRLSPINADSLVGLAPAVVVTAEFDPLRDEGEAYADKLAAAGVPVDKVRYDGLIHGFLDMGSLSPVAAAGVDDLVARFRRLLHG